MVHCAPALTRSLNTTHSSGGTFILFPLFGFSINTLSMFGLVLAIGLVVDDAIVVVEGCNTTSRNAWLPRMRPEKLWKNFPVQS